MEDVGAHPRLKALFFTLHITILFSIATAIFLTVDLFFIFIPFLRPLASSPSIFSILIGATAPILVFLSAFSGIVALVLGKIGERYRLAEEKNDIRLAMIFGFYNLGGAVFFMVLVMFCMFLKLSGLNLG